MIFSKPYSTEEYIAQMSERTCVSDMQKSTMDFIGELGDMLSGMKDNYDLIQ